MEDSGSSSSPSPIDVVRVTHRKETKPFSVALTKTHTLVMTSPFCHIDGTW